MRCGYCDMELVNLNDLGESKARLYCSNTRCSGKWLEQECPECQSENIMVLVLGIGSGIFGCGRCGHRWQYSTKL